MGDLVLTVDLGGTRRRATLVDADVIRRARATPRGDHCPDALLALAGDLATVGEARFGAGRGHDDLVDVTISTGVGAGVMIGGRPPQGRRSLAELGHTTVDLHAARQGRPAIDAGMVGGAGWAEATRRRP
jgi:2-keto-3-deoxy-galactonokinase